MSRTADEEFGPYQSYLHQGLLWPDSNTHAGAQHISQMDRTHAFNALKKLERWGVKCGVNVETMQTNPLWMALARRTLAYESLDFYAFNKESEPGDRFEQGFDFAEWLMSRCNHDLALTIARHAVEEFDIRKRT